MDREIESKLFILIIGQVMEEEGLMEEDKDLNLREAGQITLNWTKQEDCCGPLNKSMEMTSVGVTCLSLLAMLLSLTWEDMC